MKGVKPMIKTKELQLKHKEIESNDIDYIKLTQAFGDRRLLFQANKGSLGVIIRRMFDAEEVAQINAILKKKNINAQF
jgi:hypothetical protein